MTLRRLGDLIPGLDKYLGTDAVPSSHEQRRQKSARLAALCRDGFCRYADPDRDPKPSSYDLCDGYYGVEHLEASGPLMRFRLCDRRLKWHRLRRERAGKPSKPRPYDE